MGQLLQALMPLIQKIEQGFEQQLKDQHLIQSLKSNFQLLLQQNDWLPDVYRQAHSEHYQQYLLYKDAQDRFSIVSFVWNAQQSTPIHNHQVWGMVGVLQGKERVQRFQKNHLSGELEAIGHPDELDVGEIDFFTPEQGDIHQVSNPLSNGVSISIHIYGADIGKVKRFAFSVDGTATAFISGYSNSGASDV